MNTNVTKWEIRCPDCGARFYYKTNDEVIFEKGTIGWSKRFDGLVQCPECLSFFTTFVLHSWVESERNFGVIIEDE